ncbi:MAG: hypothetical protein ACRD6R_09505 [Candidatus Polarisedimenticolia bacterium]
MTHPLRQAVRFVVLLAVAGLIASLSVPMEPGGSPYRTALSDLTATTAFAAPPPRCENKECKVTAENKVTCSDHDGTACDKIPGGARCLTVAC